MRAFFAVAVPDSLAEPLAAIQADLDDAAGLRFTDPTQAHVTLRFLGEIGESGTGDDATDRNEGAADAGDEGATDCNEGDADAGDDEGPALNDVIAAGDRAVAAADRGPFECELAGLGVFPDLDYISVVWAGIGNGTADLAALHEALDRETTAIGVDPTEHAFTPHVTLARMNDARGKALVQRVVRERDPVFGRFGVDEIELIRSTLTSDGPEYETIATFPLGGR